MLAIALESRDGTSKSAIVPPDEMTLYLRESSPCSMSLSLSAADPRLAHLWTEWTQLRAGTPTASTQIMAVPMLSRGGTWTEFTSGHALLRTTKYNLKDITVKRINAELVGPLSELAWVRWGDPTAATTDRVFTSVNASAIATAALTAASTMGKIFTASPTVTNSTAAAISRTYGCTDSVLQAVDDLVAQGYIAYKEASRRAVVADPTALGTDRSASVQVPLAAMPDLEATSQWGQIEGVIWVAGKSAKYAGWTNSTLTAGAYGGRSISISDQAILNATMAGTAATKVHGLRMTPAHTRTIWWTESPLTPWIPGVDFMPGDTIWAQTGANATWEKVRVFDCTVKARRGAPAELSVGIGTALEARQRLEIKRLGA